MLIEEKVFPMIVPGGKHIPEGTRLSTLVNMGTLIVYDLLSHANAVFDPLKELGLSVKIRRYNVDKDLEIKIVDSEGHVCVFTLHHHKEINIYPLNIKREKISSVGELLAWIERHSHKYMFGPTFVAGEDRGTWLYITPSTGPGGSKGIMI